MNERKEIQLSELCDSVDYGFTASASKEPCGPKFLRITDIVPGFINWPLVPFAAATLKEEEKYKLHDGDIVIARTGATTGASAYIRNPPDAIFASYLVRLKIKPTAISLFVSYFLKSSVFWNHIRGVLGDKSAQPNASAKTMVSVKLNIPPITEQKAIASVLGALDEKIENNRRMNETLEEMARAIFKSWFVDFDPVHAKAAGNTPAHMDADTAALFPSSFGDDGLPVDWGNTTVGDLVVPNRGKTITKSRTKEGIIPVIAGGLEPAYFHNQSNVKAPVITISASGANAGFTRLYNENIWASDCSYISEQQTETIYFWYVFLKTHQNQIYHMQQGAAQPHIYPSDLMRLELSIPNDNKLIKHFEHLISPYFQKISIAQKESKILAELRDTLLPKLMSGEIRVKDAEHQVAEAV